MQGPKLFNCLPKAIRNLTNCSKDAFKQQLDKFLCTVPDEHLSFQVTLAWGEQNQTQWQLWHPYDNTGLNEMGGLNIEKNQFKVTLK